MIQRSTWVGRPCPGKSYSKITGGNETYLEIMKNKIKKILRRFYDSFYIQMHDFGLIEKYKIRYLFRTCVV
jgi:hypothetical protein